MSTEKEFLSALVADFPEFTDEILDEDYDGLLSLQIGVLTNHIRKSLKENDLQLFKRAMIFLDASFGMYNHKVDNALIVSLLEHLDIDRKIILNIMPKKIKDIYVKITNYNDSPPSENVKNFLKKI